VAEVKNETTTVNTTVAQGPTAETKVSETVTIQKVRSTHKVKSGENLSTIAKKYKVTVAELKSWNSLSSDRVMIGQSLKIISKQAVVTKQNNEPKAETLATNTAVKEEVKKEEPKVADQKAEAPNENKEVVFVSTKVSTAKATGEWSSHTVKAGESLFSLSKQYGSSIEELIQWNALTSNNLKVGQSIKVGRAATESVTVPVVGEVKSEPTVTAAEPKQETTITNTSTNPSSGFTNTKESGLAEVIPGTEANKKYLVLHRNAPVGSVIRVKNEENDLTIFARVVGVLPETGDNAKVLIKLSQAAFEQLKGVNNRFPVEILY
jgi:LysM repeat protein